MTVTCPKCGTRYRVPGGKRLADTAYRCTRCRHVFEADASDGNDSTVPLTAAIDDDEERFTFDDEPTDDAVDQEPEKPPAPRRRAEHPAPVPSGSSVGRFAVRAIVAVTLVYAVLSIYLFTHPTAIREVLGHVPLIGSGLADTRMSPASVQLTDVRGTYTRVQGDHLVFVITGTAINNSPVVVRGVQLQGKISGSREDRQTVFCGPPPRAVEDLSLQEIALLQTLEAPRDWSLPAGGQAGFMIVFPQPAHDVHEMAVEVVAVQATRRHSDGPAGLAGPSDRTATR
ncbi:MAG: zinc-ribbon domain-containing protein [Candidatus Binatia bacterium]